jgi:hypothetical protein
VPVATLAKPPTKARSVLDVLDQILCWIQQIGAMFLSALVDGVNLVIAGLAGFVQALIDADPISFPDIPDWPGTMDTALGWVAWVFPVATVIAILGFVLVAWLAWQLIALGLRWAKLLGDA